jgi:hypothetical protein
MNSGWMRRVENQGVEFVHATRERPQDIERKEAINLNWTVT